MISVKLYIDPITVREGGLVNVKGVVVAPLDFKLRELEMVLSVYYMERLVFRSGPVITRGIPDERGEHILFTRDWEVPVPSGEGRYDVVLEVLGSGGRLLGVERAFFYSFKPGVRPTLLVAVVWHNHQAPNYTPKGKYHADWAMRHVWDTYLEPLFRGGAYFVHALAHLRHPEVKVVQHLSPSLLKQWEEASRNGYERVDGTRYDRSSPEVGMVRWVLETFKRLVRERRVEVITSVYAHTIVGFLLWKFSMHDVVFDELKLGLETTRRIMEGADVKGVWTPEMAFSMGLVSMYSKLGLKYTILCGRIHFEGAEGDKASIYEPYYLVDESTGERIVVFFRDQPISDYIGFHNNYPTPYDADRGAREVIEMLMMRYYLQSEGRPSLVVIALDGENWIVFSKYPANAAYFLERLYYYLESAQEQGALRTVTLSEALSLVPPERTLTYVPTTSWLGGFYKWYGEAGEDHFKYWDELLKRYHMIKAYEYLWGDNEELSYARWCLYHALDSDYWWKEFFSPDVIGMWLREIDKVLEDGLKQVSAKIVDAYLEEPGVVKVKVGLANRAARKARLKLHLLVKPSREELVVPVDLPPQSEDVRTLALKAVKGACGDSIAVVLRATAGPLVLEEHAYRLRSKRVEGM